jgi:glycosyltransferase involved in cell wall biosynthesis
VRVTLRSLYICYLSLEDPLVHTQVVAYLAGIAGHGHTIHLVTYEAKLSRRRRRELGSELAAQGLHWHALRYHKRPSLPATAFDVLWGAVVAGWLVVRHRLDAVHARNHVPAAAALIACRLTRRRLIFDMRGLMAEEYVDWGHWPAGGIAYRLTKAIERAAIRRCDAMICLTRAVRRHLFGAQANDDDATVIPCCADTDRIDAARDERATVRAELGLSDRPVLVYVGKFGGRYLAREMVDFLAVARDELPGLAFLVLTQVDRAVITAELDRRQIPDDDYRITRVPAQAVGRYLAAADFGLAFVRPLFSEIAASPTKIGEYLAAGLPVVAPRGVGDLDRLLDDSGAGVLVDRFGDDVYADAAKRIAGLLERPGLSEHCRSVAGSELSLREVGIPRYDAVYRRVADLI